MIKFEVRNRFTGAVQFTAEIDCTDDAPRYVKLGLSVRWAIASDANLYDADLRGANLCGANLYRADLSGADLRGAILSGADLRDAILYGANLYGANLYGADLSGADLCGADLICGPQRSDGYRFLLYRNPDNGTLTIVAGCRKFGLEAARQHWQTTRAGTPLGDETFAILDFLERMAKLRGWM
jgi:hypothetical protein